MVLNAMEEMLFKIDTSNLTLEEAVERIVLILRKEGVI